MTGESEESEKGSAPVGDKRKWSDWPPSPRQWFAAIVILAAGMWQLLHFVYSERLTNLQDRLEQAESRSIPATTESQAEQPQDVADLSARIETLEQEKKALVSQMTELSRDALDPRSELGVLVRQLESDDRAERMAAASGLFAIDDPRTVQPLVDYYWKHRDEAGLPDDYMWLALRRDKVFGVDFVIRVLGADDEWHAERAFELLNHLVIPVGIPHREQPDDFDEVVRPALESVALRSEDALVRTRAKVILERRQEHEERWPEVYGENQPEQETAKH